MPAPSHACEPRKWQHWPFPPARYVPYSIQYMTLRFPSNENVWNFIDNLNRKKHLSRRLRDNADTYNTACCTVHQKTWEKIWISPRKGPPSIPWISDKKLPIFRGSRMKLPRGNLKGNSKALAEGSPEDQRRNFKSVNHETDTTT